VWGINQVMELSFEEDCWVPAVFAVCSCNFGGPEALVWVELAESLLVLSQNYEGWKAVLSMFGTDVLPIHVIVPSVSTDS